MTALAIAALFVLFVGVSLWAISRAAARDDRRRAEEWAEWMRNQRGDDR